MTNLIETPEGPDMADPFKRMATRIELNVEQGFAGAFTICAPGGEVVEMLLLDNKANPAIFWGLLKTHAEMALQELQDKESTSRAYGYR